MLRGGTPKRRITSKQFTNLLKTKTMDEIKNGIKMVRLYYGQKVYGVTYDDGREGGYVELAAGEEPSFDNVLTAILAKEWPLERRMNLADMQRYQPNDVETIKETNAYSFEFSIAFDAAKAAMASFAASTAMS